MECRWKPYDHLLWECNFYLLNIKEWCKPDIVFATDSENMLYL
jgi:hypothetical protein